MADRRTLLPDVADFEAYRRLRGDPSVWLDAVAAICRRHEIDGGDLYAERSGTNVVFRAGRGPWIKLFAPLWPEDHLRERTGLAAVRDVEGLAVPRLLAEGTLEGWPYVVLGHIAGTAIGDVWTHDLDDGARVDLARQLGELLARLHRVDTASCDPIREDWSRWAAEQRAACVERQRGYGLERSWVEALERHVAGLDPAVTDATRLVFLHADVTDEHVYVQRVDGRWRVTGLIDFGDAMVGDPFYEFAAPLVFLAQRRPAVQRALLAGYGLPAEALTPHLTRRLAAWCLLHRWGRIPTYARCTPGPAPRDLDDLLEALWSPALP